MILLCCSPLITRTKIGTICKSKACDLHINQSWLTEGCAIRARVWERLHSPSTTAGPFVGQKRWAHVSRLKLSGRKRDGVCETINRPKQSAGRDLELLGTTGWGSNSSDESHISHERFSFLFIPWMVSTSWECTTTVWNHFPQWT